jgi:hypothetical protein
MHRTACRPKIVVSADGTGLVSQAGGLLLTQNADARPRRARLPLGTQAAAPALVFRRGVAHGPQRPPPAAPPRRGEFPGPLLGGGPRGADRFQCPGSLIKTGIKTTPVVESTPKSAE